MWFYVLFILLLGVYASLGFYAYSVLILEITTRKKIIYAGALAIYLFVVQLIAIELLGEGFSNHPGLHEPVWIINSFWGFEYTLNQELLLYQLVSRYFDVSIPAFLTTSSPLKYLVHYGSFFVLMKLMIWASDNDTPIDLWLLWIVALVVYFLTALVYGPGAHDFNMIAVSNYSITGDTKDIAVLTIVFVHFARKFTRRRHETSKSGLATMGATGSAADVGVARTVIRRARRR